MKWISKILIKWLVRFLTSPSESRAKKTTNSLELLSAAIRPGDVLLVEGKERFSTAIKFLTQSNWSHAAIFVGNQGTNQSGEVLDILEADIEKGVQIIPLKTYASYHTRICRPKDLEQEDLSKIINFCFQKIGYSYDIKNVFDLARYLFPWPLAFLPKSLKSKALQFGSGDPTKVICSSLIAEAFQYVNYPILPLIEKISEEEKYKRLDPTLFTPSDFDRSPYFQIIKPTLEHGFSYKKINWQ